MLLRRNDNPGGIAYYPAYSPRRVPLTALVTVAGQRWRVEESFQTSKGLTGLDQHQVRRWTSWRRSTTLTMLAHAFLTVAATERTAQPAPHGLIPLTVNESWRPFDALLLRLRRTLQGILDWQPGDDNTRPEHAPATTEHEQTNNDHELRLQY